MEKRSEGFMNRRDFLKVTGALGIGSLVLSPGLVTAQTKTRLSIATGGTGRGLLSLWRRHGGRLIQAFAGG